MSGFVNTTGGNPLLAGREFVEMVWSQQPWNGYATMVYRPEEKDWREYFFTFPDDMDRVAEFPDDGDLYFCPNLFKERRRTNATVNNRCRWLYLDLDEVTPIECDPFPTFWWETSEARYQAIWLLEYAVNPKRHQRWNRALNRAVGADRGVHDLARLLRVPGSYNLKRDCMVGPAHTSIPVLASHE